MQYREWSVFDKRGLYYAYLGEEMLVSDSLVDILNLIDEAEDGPYGETPEDTIFEYRLKDDSYLL